MNAPLPTRLAARLFSALAFSYLAIAAPAAPSDPIMLLHRRQAAPPAVHHLKDAKQDLPNFHPVAPGIYRGAAPTDAGLAQLKAMGVRTIIDLRIEKKGQAEEAKTAQTLGMNRLRIPLGREAPTKRQVETFLATLNDPRAQPVYVHCQYGADRTGAMVGIYRVTHDHWTFDQAYAEMRKYGFKPFLSELKGAVRDRVGKGG